MGERPAGKRPLAAKPDDSLQAKRTRSADVHSVVDVDAAEDEPLPQGNIVGDVARFIDRRKTCCTNEDPENPHTNALAGVPCMPCGPAESLLVSNCDAQLLFEIGFTGAVRLQRLHLRAPGDGRAPARLQLYANSASMDFNSAEQAVPTQTFDLTDLWHPVDSANKEATDVTCELALSVARFQSVLTLTLFVVDNVGELDTSALRAVTVIGARVHRVIVVPGVL